MKILYGVQATGNGHITRARALNKWFSEFDIEVDFLLSGRELDKFWDMEEFGDWRCHKGLTFYHEAGKVKFLKTIRQNKVINLFHDIKNLDLNDYDLVLTDFEPITAWAARRQNKLCVGVGHQYAFTHQVPSRGATFMGSNIMKYFAPVDIGLGLHWHHFNSPILPPIAEIHSSDEPNDPKKIVVYLGFEETDQVIRLLEPFDDTLFTYYAPFPQYESRGHIQLKPLSREGFQHDLATASGVICNAGFELASEAIQLGKKLLVKPLAGQMEQLSNAEALSVLGIGTSMDTLDSGIIADWLKLAPGKRVIYPDVAKAIAEWISLGDWRNEAARNQMVTSLWEATQAPGVDSFNKAPLPNIQTNPVAFLNKA